MGECQYRGELVYFGNTGDFFGDACSVTAHSLDEAKVAIERRLTSKQPSVWLRILENGIEVEFREISDRKPQLPQVGSFS